MSTRPRASTRDCGRPRAAGPDRGIQPDVALSTLAEPITSAATTAAASRAICFAPGSRTRARSWPRRDPILVGRPGKRPTLAGTTAMPSTTVSHRRWMGRACPHRGLDSRPGGAASREARGVSKGRGRERGRGEREGPARASGRGAARLGGHRRGLGRRRRARGAVRRSRWSPAVAAAIAERLFGAGRARRREGGLVDRADERMARGALGGARRPQEARAQAVRRARFEAPVGVGHRGRGAGARSRRPPFGYPRRAGLPCAPTCAPGDRRPGPVPAGERSTVISTEVSAERLSLGATLTSRVAIGLALRKPLVPRGQARRGVRPTPSRGSPTGARSLRAETTLTGCAQRAGATRTHGRGGVGDGVVTARLDGARSEPSISVRRAGGHVRSAISERNGAGAAGGALGSAGVATVLVGLAPRRGRRSRGRIDALRSARPARAGPARSRPGGRPGADAAPPPPGRLHRRSPRARRADPRRPRRPSAP